ncbi:MAG TPA: OmpW family outer membrane protein [Kofleriaceae bacterium]|nr:OmpW family outer membrane protein [Kofleriaceae bacterium]
MKTPRFIVAALLVASPAYADREGARPREGTLSFHRLYVRGGVLHMQPYSDSEEVVLRGVDGAASLAVMDGPIEGSGVALDAMTRPAVIVGYTLPWWGERVSLETVLSTPLHVTFRATGTLRDMSIAPTALGIPTGVPPLGSELGEAEAAPPLVTAVYRLGKLGPILPYAGGGVSVLVTYNARATNPVLTEVEEPRFEVDPGLGLVLQAGTDVRLWRSVHLRGDVKYIAFMKANATVDNIHVRTPNIPLFESAEVGSASMGLWVNPLIVQLGLGVDL